MRPIVLTIDALYTNAALPHSSAFITFITDDDAKMFKTATYFPYNGLSGGLPLCDLHFYRPVSILTRDIDIANLSVRYVPVSDENGLTFYHTFFTIR